MFSYLQSKFTIPYFLGRQPNAALAEQLSTAHSHKKHVELTAGNAIALKRQLLDWTQTIDLPLVWLRLDALDVDPGRFWTVLVYGIRKHYPCWGHALLSGIIDHHAAPNPQVFAQFKKELAGKPFLLVVSDCHLIRQGSLSKQLFGLLDAFRADSMLVFLNNQGGSLFAEESPWLSRFAVATPPSVLPTEEQRPLHNNLLAILDTWWLPWLRQAAVFNDAALIAWLESNGAIDFLTDEMLMPSGAMRSWLRDPAQAIDYQWMSDTIRTMSAWLVARGEWLEAFRWLLFIKDFEAAGELLETDGVAWLNTGGDALTLLFWLRELPSVLLSARPVPAYLAAKAALQLGLKTQARFYLTYVENNLEAIARFNRGGQPLSDVPITEAGLTVQHMLDLVQSLKEKL